MKPQKMTPTILKRITELEEEIKLARLVVRNIDADIYQLKLEACGTKVGDIVLFADQEYKVVALPHWYGNDLFAKVVSKKKDGTWGKGGKNLFEWSVVPS